MPGRRKTPKCSSGLLCGYDYSLGGVYFVFVASGQYVAATTIADAIILVQSMRTHKVVTIHDAWRLCKWLREHPKLPTVSTTLGVDVSHFVITASLCPTMYQVPVEQWTLAHLESQEENRHVVSAQS